MPFEFATAGRILFGEGVVREVPALAAESGRHALLVTGRSPERAASLVERLGHIRTALHRVTGEPTTETIARGLQSAREAGCDHVIGIGGGSVIDEAKIISALMTNGGELMDYLEVIGKGKPLAHPAAPYIAIPTTAGTGAEVTRNAVVGSPEHRVKVSMRNYLMLPRYAVIDPELTYDLPKDVTASSGLDALTQLMEVFVSDNTSPMTDAVCREGLHRARSLRAAWESGDKEARSDMCLAALCSGMALANARLGAVHGLAGPLGGMYPAPHGAVCARLLPFVMETNVRALRARDPENRSLARYDEIARILTGSPADGADEGLAWVNDLCGALKVPPLSVYGVTRDAFADVVSKSRKSSSMKGNPVVLTDDELTGILDRAM